MLAAVDCMHAMAGGAHALGVGGCEDGIGSSRGNKNISRVHAVIECALFLVAVEADGLRLCWVDHAQHLGNFAA